MLYLICYVHGDDDCDVAQIFVHQPLVERLLGYRDAWQAAKAAIPTLYSLELFDYEAVYATRQRVLPPGNDVEYGAWWCVPRDCIPEAARLPVSPATLVVTEDGVYWQASHKHADTPRSFETEVLLFDDLLNYATGGLPWVVPAAAPDNV